MRLMSALAILARSISWTPHNLLGFLAVDEIAIALSIRVERPEGKVWWFGKKVAGRNGFGQPQTYIESQRDQRSRPALEKYELGPEDLLVMFDERDLPWGMNSHRGTRQRVDA